jgi:NTP pyrophosphatase (non-canonical NTP hydrolase)
MKPQDWDLSSVVDQILSFREERDWAQFHRPKELAAGLAIEAAELQELFLWREGEAAANVSQDAERMKSLADEIGDVAIYLLMLSHDLGVNLPNAIEEKLAKNAKRYPTSDYKGSSDKAPH